MKNVARLAIFGLVAAACSAPGQSAPPASAPPPPQAFNPQAVPPPSAFAHPGYAFYSQGGPAPAPALRMPPAMSLVERVNVSHLQLAARMPRRCDVPLEVADGVFVHVDCHPYQRIPIAVKHASALKLAMARSGRLHWNSAMRQNIQRGVGPHSMRDTAPGEGGSTLAFGLPMGAVTAPSDAQPVPDLVDHRLNGLEGPVKDQGDVGACTAFALSSVIDNALRRANQNITTSPEHVWAHYATPTMEDAAQGNLNKGITTFEILPYSGREACEIQRDVTDDCGQTYGVMPNTAQGDAQLQQKLRAADATGGHRVIAYEELDVHPANIDEIVATLASGADIWAGFDVDSSVWVSRKMQNFVIPDWSVTDGGHALVLAGYRRVNGGLQFLVHNSWGPKWGDGGYAWISQAMVSRWMHLGYKIRTDVDAGSPTSPVPPKTDEDCPGDQVMDAASGKCVGICPDQSRAVNGQCPNGPAPPPQALPLPPLPPGWQIPGLPAIPGWPQAQPAPSGQPAQPGQAPPPASSSQPPGAWQIPSAWPSAWPQFFPPPPAPAK